MAAMNYRVVTVFGGTGFLGRRVVRHLRNGEFSVRIASRHPERGEKLFCSDDHSQSTPTFRGRSPMHLLALTVW
jgi:nucleoside-diphosphate-sugar epimerase